jgi:group I intron endonuclease
MFFQRVYDKYGEDAFVFDVLRTKTLADAIALEQRLLDKHHGAKNCMNIGRTASGGDNLTSNPNRADIIARMTKAVRKHIAGLTHEEILARFSRPGESNPMYGRTHRNAVKRRLSERQMGNQHAKGSVRTPEHRILLSEHAKTRTGDKNGFYGKHHSNDTKQRLAEIASKRAASGILPSNTLQIKIGRKTYRSASEASRAVGCSTATILNRIRSDKFPEYVFA